MIFNICRLSFTKTFRFFISGKYYTEKYEIIIYEIDYTYLSKAYSLRTHDYTVAIYQ